MRGMGKKYNRVSVGHARRLGKRKDVTPAAGKKRGQIVEEKEERERVDARVVERRLLVNLEVSREIRIILSRGERR